MKEKVRDSTTTVLLQMLSKNASRNWVVTEATMYKITSMLGWNDLEVEKIDLQASCFTALLI